MVRCVFHSVICCTIMHICMQVHVGVTCKLAGVGMCLVLNEAQTMHCILGSTIEHMYTVVTAEHLWNVSHVYCSDSGTPMECLMHSNS